MLDRLTIERMDAAARGGPIVVAFSGGGDSTALLHLLLNRFDARRLCAVIVDHALRPGSADDAARAEAHAAACGVAVHAVRLDWPISGITGGNRSQQSARAQRYAALCAAARERGAHTIALGHTADDQAETIFMRAAAGSTWRGLAGMAAIAPAPLWPDGRGIVVARPLLGARRDELRAFLRASKRDWIEDPANANTAYERVRVRARLRALAEGGFDPMRLTRLAAQLRAHAEAIDVAAAALICDAARFCNDRIVVARPRWLGGAEIRRRALSALIAAAAGAEREPQAHALNRLEASIASSAFQGATLAGARVQIERGGFVLDRDRGALEGRADGAPGLAPLALPGGREVVWDGRLALTASGQGVSVTADPPAPRLSVGEEHDPAILVQSRWLLAERAAHALNVAPAFVPGEDTLRPQNEINVPKP